MKTEETPNLIAVNRLKSLSSRETYDLTLPASGATSPEVYRFWRDLGHAIGALLAGLIAHLLGMRAAIHVVAALTRFCQGSSSLSACTRQFARVISGGVRTGV